MAGVFLTGCFVVETPGNLLIVWIRLFQEIASCSVQLRGAELQVFDSLDQNTLEKDFSSWLKCVG